MRFVSYLEFVICCMELYSEVYLYIIVLVGWLKIILDFRDLFIYFLIFVVMIKIFFMLIFSFFILNFIFLL